MADNSVEKLHGSAGGMVANRMLIVEDDSEMAASLKALLEENKFEVFVAKDGGQAHSMLAMRQPDFVILDLILRGESGFEICERIKREKPDLPVLVLTVIDMPDARDLATRVGADGYLVKPVDPGRLLAKITAIAEKRWEATHLGDKTEEGKIRFRCGCGKKFRVSSTHKGRTMTCPDCGATLVVPAHS